MEAPTGLHRLRGPSPIVWAMRTRVAPPPRLAEPIPRPVYPPPPPPRAPLPPPTEKRRRGRPRKVACLPPPPGLGPPPGFAPSPAARPNPAAHGEPSRPDTCSWMLDRLVLAEILRGRGQGKGTWAGSSRTCSPLPWESHISRRKEKIKDIISRVMAVSQLNSKAICILSALGSVREAVLVQPSGVILTHKGPLEIIRLSGSILTSNDHRSLRITLASVNSFVISGIIAGPLIAETPVQAILGSFHNSAFLPNNVPRGDILCYPNTQGAITNGSTLPSERSNPVYASRTSMERNESSEVDVKPFVGLVNLNPEYASRTPVVQRESYQALLGSFHNNLFSPNNTPRAAIACYPNTQGATGNGSTLPSDRVKPQYASRTSVEQNESDEVDVKPFVGLLNPNPEYASRTPVERNESSEIDVKPFVGLAIPNPEYAPRTPVERNESS
uniref:AT-hook motif nuclear-localized protein n=1 Tax=Aegilops tauschii TaxID=37682 RepID=M8BNT3_AEGTA